MMLNVTRQTIDHYTAYSGCNTGSLYKTVYRPRPKRLGIKLFEKRKKIPSARTQLI